VLGIERPDGSYLGTPRGDDIVRADDTLILYGRRQRIAELDARTRADGQRAHEAAIAEQREREAAAS
jgi:Trk K+ transport system NAD-binding subunit